MTVYNRGYGSSRRYGRGGYGMGGYGGYGGVSRVWFCFIASALKRSGPNFRLLISFFLVPNALLS